MVSKVVSTERPAMSDLRVFTFAPDWGLPTTGPFALKLLAWLNHAGIPYRQVIENRPDKGPLGKSPWIEHDGRIMGDSGAIIRHLALHQGMADPAEVVTADMAYRDALVIAFEERFHQVLEWELFVHPQGAAAMRRFVISQLPPVLGSLVFRQMQRHFARQLHARGIARLAPAEIADSGRRMLDGLALCLSGGARWLGGDAPALADFAVWGQVAPPLCWPMPTPVAKHAKTLEPLAEWHSRIMTEVFQAAAKAA
jgi:glutathione S-transferase